MFGARSLNSRGRRLRHPSLLSEPLCCRFVRERLTLSSSNVKKSGKWASLACHETGSLVIQTLQHLLDGLLDFATSEQGAKSITKALKEVGQQTLDWIVERMCEGCKWVPPSDGR
ncbi:hypothetical protein C0995_015683 [Termitomyces sp. Mi166|nr:hypothetical protein C0995_015683 [Termitomyces sp. Mi166\